MYGKGNGQKVNMKLAGNVTKATAMNQFGEVMIKDSQPKGQYDIGWILPVSRLQDELGITISYRGDGSSVLVYPTGDEVILIRDQGLAYVEWDDFWPIRKLLAESHKHGRPRNGSKVTSAILEQEEIREVRCNICAATQTDDPSMESEEWQDWVQSTIVEDDRLFCSATVKKGKSRTGVQRGITGALELQRP